MLQQKESQSQHEIKRRDQEIQKLKERLVRVVSNKSPIFMEEIGITTSGSNANQTPTKPRSRWNKNETDRVIIIVKSVLTISIQLF